ncbi:H-NS histone family protein [Alphaproteobacteria bacterium]|nr:H-NS histone family protein [Alphaproteobacteria bacterium]MDB2540627.1 H-NS histone family protein [Alphaproteobacteria bacterium]MDB2649165.1 H-NS histone family protein [Alphaproteobacteria bacterium]
MKIIKRLSDSELAVTARQIEAETKLRANRRAAATAILAVLKKHNLSVGDLSDLGLKTVSKGKRTKSSPTKKRGRPAKTPKAKSISTKAKKTKSTDKRVKVAMKYKNPTGSDKWAGRGRSPKWVAEILTKQKITLAEFKQDKRYKI